MNKQMMLVLLSAGIVLLGACSSKNVINTPQLSVKVVETIPASAAPSWVDSTQEFWEKGGQYFYRGTAEGFTNLEAAKRAAAANARVNLAEQVKNVVRNEFSRALEAGAYDENTGGYLKDVFFSAVENITLSGVQVRESYLQRLLETGDINERLYYRAYVLSSISKTDYNKLVRAAFSDTKAQVAANKSAKQLALETEARFWQQQQGALPAVAQTEAVQ